MKKTVEVLFTRTDEREFSALLTAAFPMVSFIDDDVWPTPEPPLVPSIEQCTTPFCFIWNRAIDSTPRSATPCVHGGFYGSATASIQFLRCRSTDYILQAGRMAASTDDGDVNDVSMLAFIKTVWKLAKKFAKTQIDHVRPEGGAVLTPRAPGFLVGPDAAAWCLADKHRYFKCWAGTWFLRPCDEQIVTKPPRTLR